MESWTLYEYEYAGKRYFCYGTFMGKLAASGGLRPPEVSYVRTGPDERTDIFSQSIAD